MTERFYDEQIEGLIVNSVTGTHVDNSDPKNPKLPEFVLKSVYDLAMLNKANIDGSNTVGGTWYIDTILSDLFPSYKQVIRVLGGQMAIEYGNVELSTHRFLLDNTTGLKIKVGNEEGYILNTLNFDAEQFEEPIPDWSNDLETLTPNI